LSLERFLYFIVIPFFYRLAYVDAHGIQAARQELWEEYAHGSAGRREHRMRMLEIRDKRLGRNDRCACDSGMKYKHCCMDEVQWISEVICQEQE
jgi:hypothetical protein